MLISRLRVQKKTQSGFALPTVLIASIVMLIVLLSAVSASSSVRVSLDDQYYNKLAVEAAEAGHARAESCLAASNYTPTWTDSTRLRPDTKCTGASLAGASRYVAEYGNVRTTFVVWAPVTGAGSSAKVTVVGTTELIRTSTDSVYQTYSQTLVRQSNYASVPQLAGGAGWKGAEHFGVILTAEKQLYGFGANGKGQVTDSKSPASVLIPTPMTLPDGVSSATKVITAGQGGSFVCIMANTAQVWCRGEASVPALMPIPGGWHKFNLPGSLTAVSVAVSSYGVDSMCVVASDSQAYCAGDSFYGSLGNNNTAYSITTLATPEKFRVDIPEPGAMIRKMVMNSSITCGITTTDKMYCAGLNLQGQIAGPVLNGTGNGSYAVPIRYPLPGARTVDDASITYHTTSGRSVVHALATDGTIWSSGTYESGDLGNGTTTGNTGTSQTPVLFTHSDVAYKTGSVFWNAQSGRCIDNNGNNPTNGNIIWLYDCNGSVAQGWIYGKDKQLTNMGTGKCLDLPGNSTSPAPVYLQLYDCNNSPAQQFDLVGANTIVHIATGLCVDAYNNGTLNGTRLHLWGCGAGNPAQSFTTYQGINGWRGMITGPNHFCAIRSDQWSGMWCAGRNTNGQLANVASGGGSFLGQCENAPASGHNIFNANLPGGAKVDVTKLTDEWRSQFLSTMVIATNGKVYGAGRNEFGKLGNGTLGDSAYDFRECLTKEFILPSGVTAMNMSTRDEYTTYVLGSDGRVYAAGRNNLGQVGDETNITRPTPVEVKVPRLPTLY